MDPFLGVIQGPDVAYDVQSLAQVAIQERCGWVFYVDKRSFMHPSLQPDLSTPTTRSPLPTHLASHSSPWTWPSRHPLRFTPLGHPLLMRLLLLLLRSLLLQPQLDFRILQSLLFDFLLFTSDLLRRLGEIGSLDADAGDVGSSQSDAAVFQGFGDDGGSGGTVLVFI
jgi:hypothetical protein